MKELIKAAIPAFIKDDIRARRQRARRRKKFLSGLRQTDTFLVGHPKSGNTWLAYMLGIVLQGENHDAVNLKNVSQFVPTIHTADEKVSEWGQLSSPRVFRNEGPMFPDDYPRTLYIVRDPRAVLLSYYHHWLHTNRDDHGTLEEFIDEIVEHGCIRRWDPWLVGWDTQVQEWSDRVTHQRVMIVRYEDLIQDRRAAFQAVLDFCEIPYTQESLSNAVERGGFESMRQVEKKYGAESYPDEQGEEKEQKGFFVRKGVVDGWKDEMSKEAIQKIESAFQGIMKRFHYLPV